MLSPTLISASPKYDAGIFCQCYEVMIYVSHKYDSGIFCQCYEVMIYVSHKYDSGIFCQCYEVMISVSHRYDSGIFCQCYEGMISASVNSIAHFVYNFPFCVGAQPSPFVQGLAVNPFQPSKHLDHLGCENRQEHQLNLIPQPPPPKQAGAST